MSQKMENQLNLALETPEEVREKTADLNAGYDSAKRTWELIVKYSGSPETLAALEEAYGGAVLAEPLIAGFCILTVPEDLVDAVVARPQIEYAEKPKNFYFTQEGPSARACIAGVTAGEPFLSGEGVLMAVIDSGLSYRRPEFRKPDGTTRIVAFWDQTVRPEEVFSGAEGTAQERLPTSPEGFREGTEFDEAWINMALSLPEEEALRVLPSIDVSGHGTAVTGIAAASFLQSYRGVAPSAALLIVKLGGSGQDAGAYSKTTEIMRAVTYCVQKAQKLGMPLVINLSFGNTYGPHDGSSLLERFLDNAAQIGRTVICIGSGNEGNSAGHVKGRATTRREEDLTIAEYERGLSVQIWTHYSDRFRIRLRSPQGNFADLMPERADESGGGYVLRLDQTRILVYFGEPTPYSVSKELYMEFLPGDGAAFLTPGIWRFVIEPVRIVTGQYFMYLPPAVTRNGGTGFAKPSPDVTLTVPSSALRVISVGAYDEAYESYADFSGRGYETVLLPGERVGYGGVKPDVAAPGVNITAPDTVGGFAVVTGTSFATPIVSGSCALLMEWGIVRGKDPYLYGEKLKAYLRSGARQIRGESVYPNPKVGYGAVCVSDSLPR